MVEVLMALTGNVLLSTFTPQELVMLMEGRGSRNL